MKLSRWYATGCVLLCVAAGCGDDSDATSDDAGTPNAGKGGSGGKAGRGAEGGQGGAAGRGNAGRGNEGGARSEGGTGGGSSDQTQRITIRFKAKVGDRDLACGTSYSGVGSKSSTVEPADFRFFVQDVALIDDGGKEVKVKLDERAPWQLEDVALLDFEDGKGPCSGEGNSETNLSLTGTVPKGAYTGITFSNGVPEQLNHGDPTTFKDPLKTYASMSWGWLIGFRFVIVSLGGAGEADADGGTPGGLLHLGSTGCSNASAADGGVDFGAPPEIECLKANRNKIKLNNYKVGESVIVADAAKLFEKTDLSAESNCHSGGDACPAIFDSIGVDFSNGKARSTQSFYRLE